MGENIWVSRIAYSVDKKLLQPVIAQKNHPIFCILGCKSGAKPAMIFNGDKWDNDDQSAEILRKTPALYLFGKFQENNYFQSQIHLQILSKSRISIFSLNGGVF